MVKEEDKRTLSPEDVDQALIKRLEDRYGPVQDTDFFTQDLKTYFKTDDVNKETGSISHKVINLASFGDSLKKMSNATKALKQLMGTDDARDDEDIRKIYDELKGVFNKYRTHLRKFYPEQYRQVKNTLEEMSTTGGGAGSASFTPGTGMQYATPFAFKLKKKKKVDEGIGATLGPGPKAGETGVKDSAYVKQFKYKLVPKKIKGSGLEVKQLFEAESAEDFQKGRIASFDVIEQELNDIYKMLSNAKNETSTYYNDNPSSYSVVKPTDLVLDYIKDIKDLLKGE
jgi:hypothetical protein|tara:strand:+ start:6642 stop:7496 length:855 start_codon:yes stop_codon:yes gene_type:complete